MKEWLQQHRTSEALNVLNVAAIPLAYIAKRHLNDNVRPPFVAALWAAYLALPQYTKPMPLLSNETMMTAVMLFITPLRLTQLALLDEDDEDVEDELADESEPSGKLGAWNWVKGLMTFAKKTLWFALPIYKTPDHEKPETIWEVLRYSAECFSFGILKIVSGPIIYAKLRQLGQEEPRNFATKTKLLLLFCVSILTASYSSDLISGSVNLVTGGRYRALEFNNYALLSSSLSDLWGRRYNRLIHSLLKSSVYIPARTRGYTRAQSTAFAFGMSGILHSYVAHYMFGRGELRSFLFFFLSAKALILERYVYNRYDLEDRVHPVVRGLVTHGVMLSLLPLYGGLFVENMQEMLEINGNSSPEWAKRLVSPVVEKLELS